MAQAVGKLFEAEQASEEREGKTATRAAMGFISQALALLQEAPNPREEVQQSIEILATAMSSIYPLTPAPTLAPPPPEPAQKEPEGQALAPTVKLAPSEVPSAKGGQASPASSQALSAQGSPSVKRHSIEVNIGATTESNFYVGFSGEIAEGGVFAATYNIFPRGTPMRVLITLPGGYEKEVDGYVRFIRDPFDLSAENTTPGMGIQFERLDPETRELILRFIRKRAPMFYDE
ncbi:MAG: hypothetical protein N2515_06065 [Deltaproteobacteria bacterium]|nr:hypothetical protein [Deltaproteobacteria bacterium]